MIEAEVIFKPIFNTEHTTGGDIMERLPYASEQDVERCLAVVERELLNSNVRVNDEVLRIITIDIMSISYAKGGGYSNHIIQAFAEGYISHKLYQAHLK